MSIITEVDSIVSAYIPKDMIYVTAQVENRNVSGDFIPMVPVFPVDAANKKTLETALNWSKRRNGFNEASKKAYDYTAALKTPLQITTPNTPKSGYRLVAVDIRNEGGRAWKVITPAPDYFLFDIREEYLLSALLNAGCDKGGYLKGEYVWARVGSQMKLVLVGSELYYKILQADNKTNTKEIPLKDLVPGGVYEMKTGNAKMFLGRVNTIKFEEKYENGFRYGDAKYEEKVLKGKYVFFDFSNINTPYYREPFERAMTKSTVLEAYETYVKDNSDFGKSFEVNSGSKFYRHIKTLSISENYIRELRKKVTMSIGAESRSTSPYWYYREYSAFLNATFDLKATPEICEYLKDKKWKKS